MANPNYVLEEGDLASPRAVPGEPSASWPCAMPTVGQLERILGSPSRLRGVTADGAWDTWAEGEGHLGNKQLEFKEQGVCGERTEVNGVEIMVIL